MKIDSFQADRSPDGAYRTMNLAGLYIRELIMRADVRRILIVAPGSLVEQWRDDYVLLPFVDDFGAALGASDLVVSRAGGSVWEVAAAGKPVVLVPYPHATADHQLKNALHFEAAGGAVVVPESELEQAPAVVEELLVDPARRERMRRAMLEIARPEAADEIADELVALASA